MVDGTTVTKGGAAFANAEMAMSGGKLDSFRMLTHPGTSILPGAFVAAETAGASGKEFLTGVAVGYEVMERLASDFIPTVMSNAGAPAAVLDNVLDLDLTYNVQQIVEEIPSLPNESAEMELSGYEALSNLANFRLATDSWTGQCFQPMLSPDAR